MHSTHSQPLIYIYSNTHTHTHTIENSRKNLGTVYRNGTGGEDSGIDDWSKKAGFETTRIDEYGYSRRYQGSELLCCDYGMGEQATLERVAQE